MKIRRFHFFPKPMVTRILFVLLGLTTAAVGQQPVSKAGQAYTCPGQQPQFPGDVAAYLAKNRRYTAAQADSGIEGRTVIRFLVCDDGTIADPRVARSSGHKALDDEALRLVQGMPRWIPGRDINNRPSGAMYYLPITFQAE